MRRILMDGWTMTAAAIAKRLISEEMIYYRIKFPEARARIAREAEVSPGSLENLSRGRLKRTEWLRDKLHGLLIRKLKQRIASLQHELEIAETLGNIPKTDLAGVEAALKEARRLLGEE